MNVNINISLGWLLHNNVYVDSVMGGGEGGGGDGGGGIVDRGWLMLVVHRARQQNNAIHHLRHRTMLFTTQDKVMTCSGPHHIHLFSCCNLEERCLK